MAILFILCGFILMFLVNWAWCFPMVTGDTQLASKLIANHKWMSYGTRVYNANLLALMVSIVMSVLAFAIWLFITGIQLV